MPARAYPAQNPSQELTEQVWEVLDRLELQQWQSELDGLNEHAFGYLSVRELLRAFSSGETPLGAGDILEQCVQWAKDGLKQNRYLLVQLLALVIMAALCQQVLEPLADAGISRAAMLIVSASAVLLVVNLLKNTTQSTLSMVGTVGKILEAVFPLLTALLAASGGTATTAALQPSYALVLQGCSVALSRILVPCGLASGVLGISGHLLEKESLDQLSSSIRSGCVWCVGGAMTILAAMTGMQSRLSASFDGVSLRAAKYAVDNAVPYVGGMLADMGDSLLGGALIIKNALGMTSLITILLALGQPLLSSLVSYFILLAASAAAKLFGSGLHGVFKAAAATVLLLIVLTISAAAAALLLIAVTVQAGGDILALR